MRLRQGLVHAIDGYKNCCIDFVQSESIVIYGEHKCLNLWRQWDVSVHNSPFLRCEFNVIAHTRMTDQLIKTWTSLPNNLWQKTSCYTDKHSIVCTMLFKHYVQIFKMLHDPSWTCLMHWCCWFGLVIICSRARKKERKKKKDVR